MKLKTSVIIFLLIILCQSFYINIYGSDIKKIPLTKEEESFAMSKPTIKYAVISDYAPIEYLDKNSKPKGFGVAYLQVIEEMYDITFELVKGYENYTWNDCISALEDGDIDLLTTVTKTDGRDKFALFTNPYLVSTMIIVGHDDQELILDESHLTEKKIVLPKGFWQNEYLESKFDEIEIVNTKDMYEALEMINNKAADCTIIESTVYNYYFNQYRLDNLRIIGEIPLKSQHSIGVSKKNPILFNIISKTVDQVSISMLPERALKIKDDNENYLYKYILLSCIFVILLLSVVLFFQRSLRVQKRKKQQLIKNKNKLIENLSHDLKTPLATLKVNMALLKHDMVTKEELTEHYLLLDSNIDKLDTIISELYGITQLNEELISSKEQKIDAYRFFEEIRIEYEHLMINSNKIFTIEGNEKLKDVFLLIEKVALYRVITNILNNAIKYTKVNDEITISFETDSRKIRIDILDTGVGIKKEDINKVFDRFSKSPDSTGKGLGLAISKEIVEFYGGDISVDSLHGYYTKFTVNLPCYKKEWRV